MKQNFSNFVQKFVEDKLVYCEEDLYKDLKANYTEVEETAELEDEPKTFCSISNDDDILQMYLKDIGKVKLLNFQEEKELGKRLKRANPKKPSLQKEN